MWYSFCSLTSVLALDSLLLQAHRPSKQHLQEAFKEPLTALVDVQLVGKQREAVVLQELLLLLLESSAEIGIEQLGEKHRINEVCKCKGVQACGLICNSHMGTQCGWKHMCTSSYDKQTS